MGQSMTFRITNLSLCWERHNTCTFKGSHHAVPKSREADEVEEKKKEKKRKIKKKKKKLEWVVTDCF